MEPTEDPARRMRVSDAEREHVAEILRAAAGDGRIDADELDERLGAAYTARTVADLVPLTADLPDAPPFAQALPVRPAQPAQHVNAVVPAGPARERGVAIMSGFERRGDWLVPQHLTVTAVMGGALIDTRRARFSAPEVVITVNAIMGGAEVVVAPTTRVVMDGIGIMGGFGGPTDDSEVGPNSPTVRVRGVAIWGGVSVRRGTLDER
ncbi:MULTISPECIES: DUF1707 SHOCT-like domain-containing protein [Mumia]|uniref:DUF1707 SHOCT-like domain-containing protein n=1 Tax=Mumia TaxID=1546255 RepID=UPI00141DF336|nr:MULTISPECIES: DUF1707 domain-containing protein [unclassified Mumia]QMW66332.1 DUF1707 domain-containing protein [Mumia sp. ZJ1417]